MVPQTVPVSWAAQDLLVKVSFRNMLTRALADARICVSVWSAMQPFAWTSNRLGRIRTSALCEFYNSGRYRIVET